MNKVELIGRLVRDPEIKTTTGEKPVTIASMTLAVQRRMKKDEADFIPLKAFGTTADFIEKYFKKGMQAAVIGRITTGSYTNKENKKIFTQEVTVEEIEFAGNRNQSQEQNSEKKESYDFMNIPDGLDGDLPFM